MRVCRTCQKELPNSEFHVRENGRLRTECGACVYARVKLWRKENREKYQAQLKRRNRVYTPKPPREIVCAWCGEIAVATGNRQRFCSKLCYHRWERHRDKTERTCEGCGALLERHHRADSSVCSASCRAKVWAERNPLKIKISSANSAAKRRAREAEVGWEPIDRDELYDRDNGICHLCGEPVSRDDFELDHVVPLSRGGPTVAPNLRVAHPSCNRRKSNRLEAA